MFLCSAFSVQVSAASKIETKFNLQNLEGIVVALYCVNMAK